MILKIGCCGFAVKGGMRAYFKEFNLVELQSTFYKLPRRETAQRWRSEAPKSFQFTLKASQMVTHPPSSPTWRKAGLQVSPQDADKYGLLKPTEENLRVWDETAAIAETLRAPVVVVQCPPSFTYSTRRMEEMAEFFFRAERGHFDVAWEPRHSSWTTERVRAACKQLNLIHVVDPLREAEVSSGAVRYYRLHGLGKRLYSYRYTDTDLRRLYEEVVKPLQNLPDDACRVYLLWNNISMVEDALRFKRLLSDTG
ncbi:MAG: DUF72 domain-containing protein [Candidatus Bathyarchaeia archaeon]